RMGPLPRGKDAYTTRLLPQWLRLLGAGPLRRPLLLWGRKRMNAPQLRTIVYVDGFNFYYGAVRGTPWKWIDLTALFRLVLGPQTQLVKVKYFTARVQPNATDPRANVRQDAYLRALQAHCNTLEVY